MFDISLSRKNVILFYFIYFLNYKLPGWPIQLHGCYPERPWKTAFLEIQLENLVNKTPTIIVEQVTFASNIEKLINNKQ